MTAEITAKPKITDREDIAKRDEQIKAQALAMGTGG